MCRIRVQSKIYSLQFADEPRLSPFTASLRPSACLAIDNTTYGDASIIEKACEDKGARDFDARRGY